MKEFKLECISGSLKGKSWTFREGIKYRLARDRNADISTPPGEMTISSRNTFLTIQNGIPYVGSGKVNDDGTVGTWLNGSYLTEKADDNDIKKGWFPLNNNDTIAIGYGGREMKFRFMCPERSFSMTEARKTVERELQNFNGRRPYNIHKHAKDVNPGRIKRQVQEAMEQIYSGKNLMVEDWDKEFSEDVCKEVSQKHIRFREKEISAKKDILEHIRKDIKAQNDLINEQEEILDSPVRVKEFIPEKEKQPAKQAKNMIKERELTILSSEAAKDYKTNFSFDTLKKIGSGGFSNVFLIRDRRDQELLVLKSLDVVKNMTSIQEAKYLREADLGERLDHKNLVKTYDIRKHNGNYYMIMEHCDGGSIGDLMKESYGYLDLEEATEYFLQVLDGLDYLHNVEIEQPDQNGVIHKVKGIVHRDIKPENMLIKNTDGKRVIKISDFGLSKSYELAGYSGITNGEVAGSRKYCSKRQFSDYYKYVGPQDDVFSAAASYYEMITGKCVRDREKYKDLNFAILAGSLVPVREANPHIPQALAEVIDSVLQEESLGSESQFTTAKELKEKIKDALDIR